MFWYLSFFLIFFYKFCMQNGSLYYYFGIKYQTFSWTLQLIWLQLGYTMKPSPASNKINLILINNKWQG